ncbi:MAG TPA: decaprenyl-phosphate phosphoribosyltransferase [Vicinamibacteria bacterium]|nr:decaprenyl-phosphate phosphoribosyltransferase [Vicinamibacteria bacterium]
MKPLLVSLRPHQWTKNLILFAPLALSKHLFEAQPFQRSLLAFLLFCGLSGAVYLVNDVRDVEHDRLHPRKRLRPIASGALRASTALLVAAGLAVACLLIALLLGRAFAAAALAYLLLNLLYSLKLKEVVIVDAIAVSLGFVVRAVAGALAIGVVFSDWLLICTVLLALFLTFCKRRHELTSLVGQASDHRKSLQDYSPYLLDQMIAVVTASCLMAYASYTTASETIAKFQTDRLPWTIPFVLYGIFRYLYLVHQKEQGGSPTDLLLTDRPILVNVALWALALVAIVYTAGGAPGPIR